MKLHQACRGNWDNALVPGGPTRQELDAFLDYAATFLCNLGNYYGDDNQKFIPRLDKDALRRIADTLCPEANDLLNRIIDPRCDVPPFNIGYPSDSAQSTYYLGEKNDPCISKEEIDTITIALDATRISPKNTRVRKLVEVGVTSFHELQASAGSDLPPVVLRPTPAVTVSAGDHAAKLSKVCEALEMALQNDPPYRDTLEAMIRCLRDRYNWFQGLTDLRHRSNTQRFVDHYIGFLTASHRDPAGISAEWRAMVGIINPLEQERLEKFVGLENLVNMTRQLPWIGRGPFEHDGIMNPLGLTCVYALAFWGRCFPDISRLYQRTGLTRTIGCSNGQRARNHPELPRYWVLASDRSFFGRDSPVAKFITTVIYKQLGRVGWRLLTEEDIAGVLNPITGKPVSSFYKSIGEGWNVWGELYEPVHECRAILISEYLMHSWSVVEMLRDPEVGTTDADLVYATYLNIGVSGLEALRHYNTDTKTWSQHRAQVRFSILAHLLICGQGVINIRYDPRPDRRSLKVQVDRGKLWSEGKPALEQYLLRVHIWCCIADVDSFKEEFGLLSKVYEHHLQWRDIVCSRAKRRWNFIQPNTFMRKDGTVWLYNDYAINSRGVIQSWAERLKNLEI